MQPLLTDKEREKAIKRSNRRARKAFEEREVLSQQIEGMRHLEEIQRLLFEPWGTPAEAVSVVDPVTGMPGMQVGYRLSKETISENKAKLDGHFKMLSKLIPDLKAVEHRPVEATFDEEDGRVVLISPMTGEVIGSLLRSENKPVALPLPQEAEPWVM